jgi:Protein of unknown function (DUF4012)
MRRWNLSASGCSPTRRSATIARSYSYRLAAVMAGATLEPTSGSSDPDVSRADECPPKRFRRKPSGRPRRFSRRTRIAVLIAIGIVIVWLACVSVITFMGLRDASRAMQELEQAKSDLSASQVITTAPQEELSRAHLEFSAASGLLDSPFLSPAVVLPVIGRQVTSIRDLAHAATQVSNIGVQAVGTLRTVINAPHRSGPARIADLERLASLASTTDTELASVNPGPDGRLLPPLAKRYDQFVDQVNQIRTRLQHAYEVAGSLGEILKGPSRYLLLVANNAEMRAGSGMFLNAGTLTFDEGQVKLGPLYDTGAITVPKGAVKISGDLAARWGWLDPGQDWRNLALTPNFDEIGPVAVSMWQAVEHQQVQGVVCIDVEALQQLLEVTGPVTLSDGSTVSSSDVVQLLLHDEYENLTYSSPLVQQERESRLGSLAKATLEAVQDRSLDLKTLATAMSTATAGRHIELWSNDPQAENAWIAGGVSGELTGNSLMAAVLSRSGTKLDQYLSVSCSLSVTSSGAGGAGTSEASLSVTLANRTPPGQSPYIAGPYPHLGTVYGEYIGFLAVNIPADASSDFFATGATGPPVAWGAEGPVWLLAVPIDVKAGRSQAVVVHFKMPGAHGSVTVQPSARIPPESWSFRGRSFTDAAPFALSW